MPPQSTRCEISSLQRITPLPHMTPDAIQFAKSVLWRLASIQADVYQNQLLLVQILARQTNQTPAQVQSQWASQSQNLAIRRYTESLDAAGLPHEDGEPPEQNRFRT